MEGREGEGIRWKERMTLGYSRPPGARPMLDGVKAHLLCGFRETA